MKHVGYRFGWRTSLITKRGTRTHTSQHHDRHNCSPCKNTNKLAPQPPNSNKTKARAPLVDKVPLMSQQVSPGVTVTDTDLEISAASFDGLEAQVHFVGAGDPLEPNPPANTLKLPQSVPTGSNVTIVAVGSNVNIDPNGGTLNGSSFVFRGKALTLYFTTNQSDPCGSGTWTPECCELIVPR